jgi:DNA modification methylase
LRYSKQGDWVWDPFCGSGTIPLECRLLDRNVIAADINPYACALTRAKLHAPTSEKICFHQLALAEKLLKNMPQENNDEIPQWVKSFFHEQTLMEANALMIEFIRRRQYFNMGCLLGILHHQRPGFLSYPASHLVPYLRDRLYPREKFPDAYEYRDPISRLQAKIKRILENPPPPKNSRYKYFEKSALNRYLPDNSVDAIITSPPYMDALDYARDNRLRLWFLGVDDYKKIKDKEIRKISSFEEDMLVSLQIMSQVVKPGGVCIIIGDVKRNNNNYNVPEMISKLVENKVKNLFLENKWVEMVPNHRRTRRNSSTTQTETIIIFRHKRWR